MGKEGDAKGRRAVNGWKNAGLPWSYNMIKKRGARGQVYNRTIL
jgi:hypothetical protein